MLRENLRRGVFLEALGMVVALVLVAISFLVGSPASDLLIGVASSFLFGSFLLALRWLHRRLTRTEVVLFFGEELLNGTGVLVYPDFELSSDVQQLARDQNKQLIYEKPQSKFDVIHRVDLPVAVAANDLEALVHVSAAVQRHSTRPVDVRVDREMVEECDCSFISVGFSSNDLTHLYLETADDPLFEIVEDGSGSEFLRLKDGTERRSDPSTEWGLIVRHKPLGTKSPDRNWFFVAGLGPRATVGAAWFLRTRWRDLHSEAEHSDFAALIKVPSPAPRLSTCDYVMAKEARP